MQVACDSAIGEEDGHGVRTNETGVAIDSKLCLATPNGEKTRNVKNSRTLRDKNRVIQRFDGGRLERAQSKCGQRSL